MYKVVISELAQTDLDEIVQYMIFQLLNPAAATRFLDEVEACYQHLQTNPLIYARSNDVRLRQAGYRKAVIKHYVLMFKVNEASQTVTVYRIFYGARDYDKLL